MDSLTIKANAKINLALRVKYKRTDGYHEIETVMQEIDLHDTVTLRVSENITFNSNSDSLSGGSTNLCIQAADLLCTEFGFSGMDIGLQKRIPIGAGLGGGSSDAAAVLLGGLKLYGISLPINEIQNLSSKLGSDVPFFITGKSALATGRGEKVTPIQITTDYKVFLVYPGIKISTEWAYKNLKLGLTQQWADNKFKSFEFHGLKVSDFQSIFFNSFESVLFEEYPVLAEIKQALLRKDALFAGMSGSGSALFGLFDNDADVFSFTSDLQTKYKCLLAVPVA
jgi:4-diphosphocytidyl-2-C-methyl-D-erythritol kinase